MTIIPELPDFNTDLRIASDFIFSSRLCRRAMETTLPGGTANIIRDLLKSIDALVKSCHLPEFTDHGLPHLASLVDRASKWTLKNDDCLVELLSSEEAALCLLALLAHDMGMLSQNPLDLEERYYVKGMSDVSTWVRKTHCARLPSLLKHTFESLAYKEFVESSFFDLVCRVAMAHEEWSWQNSAKHYPKIREIAPLVKQEETGLINSDRACGIAAVIAVCDLLDEDSQRCDTETLIYHRQGSSLNKAHWLRHLLTRNRILVKGNRFKVEFGWLSYRKHLNGKSFDNDPSDCQGGSRYQQVINALKNQFSSALLYNDDLCFLNADLMEPDYHDGCGNEEIPWNLSTLCEFWGCAPERLIQSIFGFAVEPDPEIRTRWERLSGSAGFNKLDLEHYHRFLGISGEIIEPMFDEEISFRSISEAIL